MISKARKPPRADPPPRSWRPAGIIPRQDKEKGVGRWTLAPRFPRIRFQCSREGRWRRRPPGRASKKQEANALTAEAGWRRKSGRLGRLPPDFEAPFLLLRMKGSLRWSRSRWSLRSGFGLRRFGSAVPAASFRRVRAPELAPAEEFAPEEQECPEQGNFDTEAHPGRARGQPFRHPGGVPSAALSTTFRPFIAAGRKSISALSQSGACELRRLYCNVGVDANFTRRPDTRPRCAADLNRLGSER